MTFITATHEERCHDCGETIPPDAWMLPVTLRDSYYARIVRTRVTYCGDCGKLYQESQVKTGVGRHEEL
jgi:hypothetical protein